MTVYDYVAQSNPNGSANLIRSFGYDMYSGSNLADNLRELVAQNGEPALMAVLEIHPDKDVIMEAFSKKEKSSDCGCKKESYLNASGAEQTARAEMVQQASTQQSNTFILVAALLLSVAIITKN
jgi:hypothetical protein